MTKLEQVWFFVNDVAHVIGMTLCWIRQVVRRLGACNCGDLFNCVSMAQKRQLAWVTSYTCYQKAQICLERDIQGMI